MQRQLLLHIAICFSLSAAAQNVGINNATPNASALLDLTSTDKGLLVPRMTTVQRDLIPAPATSLLIFNTANARYEYFDGLAWVPKPNPSGTSPLHRCKTTLPLSHDLPYG